MDRISILSEELLIPFKAKAFLDLSQRKADGEKSAKSGDIKKHRRDVFRLAQLLPADQRIEIADTIANDLREFLGDVRSDDSFNPKQFGVGMSRDEGIALLENIYGL